jgi:hypothetical protein
MELKSLLVALSLFLSVFASGTAAADWKYTIDNTGADIRFMEISNRVRAAYFYFTTDTSSSWLTIADGVRVRFTLNDDADSATHGANACTLKLMYLHHVTDTTPSLNDAAPLLGVTLDGVAATTGLTNDAIWDVEGPMIVLADPQGVPTSACYLSAIAMRSNR